MRYGHQGLDSEAVAGLVATGFEFGDLGALAGGVSKDSKESE